MKALSVRQPFASLLMAGVKQFETRGWFTAHRGELAIHAAKTYDAGDRLMAQELARHWPEAREVIDAGLPLGEILGVVTVEGVYRTEELLPRLSGLEVALGNYAEGRAAWRVSIVRVFQSPIPAKGQLGLWDWEPEALEEYFS